MQHFTPRAIPLLLLTALPVVADPTPSRTSRGNLLLEGIPAVPETLSARLLQYQNTRSAVGVGWLPDDSGLLLTTRFGETAQFHLVRQPGGARTQLTFFREPVGAAAIHPSRPELLFTSSTGGDEFDQIYRLSLTDGRWEKLTAGRFIHRGVQWSRQGDRFAFLSNRRNGTDWDVYLASADAPRDAKRVAGRFLARRHPAPAAPQRFRKRELPPRA